MESSQNIRDDDNSHVLWSVPPLPPTFARPQQQQSQPPLDDEAGLGDNGQVDMSETSNECNEEYTLAHIQTQQDQSSSTEDMVLSDEADVAAIAAQPTSPLSHHGRHNRTLSCCCQQDDCPFQKRGKIELESLEKDVRAAATVGQALLVRHQTYAADAERDRTRMTYTIADLERRNKELEILNAQLVEENKALLEQVEGLNAAITDSDAHIKSVTATLHSTQHELQKLSMLAGRADSLEAQLRQLEAEQGQLQATLTITDNERREATQKWRVSQRKANLLQEQLDAVDQEATEERRRHAEVVERMARRRAMELELESSSATKSDMSKHHHHKKGSETVSSFVKQILHDNSNMELTMVELQQLLTNSQNEVESLREKLLDAHLASQTNRSDIFDNNINNHASQNLEAELSGFDSPFPANQQQPSPRPSQELHVHHHFHGSSHKTPIVARSKSTQLSQRSSRKKRFGSSSGRSTPLSFAERDMHRRSTSSISRLASEDGSLAMLSQSVDGSPRWSFSSAPSQHRRANSLSIISSAPSSPPSTYAPSTIFEQGVGEDDGTEYSSRPTSPESNVYSPLTPKPMLHRKDGSRDSLFQQYSLTLSSRPTSLAIPSTKTPRIDENDLMQKQSSPESLTLDHDTSDAPNSKSGKQSPSSKSPQRPQTIRRSASNSSLTISGMDIHSTLPTPSRLLAPRPSFATLPTKSGGAAALTAATALSRQHASASRSQRSTSGNGSSNTGNASAWRLLRGKLETGTASSAVSNNSSSRSYAPLLDTFGSWFSSKNAATTASSTSNDGASTSTHADGVQSPTDSSSVKSGVEPSSSVAQTMAIAATKVSHSATQARPILPPSKSDPLKIAERTDHQGSIIPRSLSRVSSSPGKRLPTVRAPGINQFGGLPLYPPGVKHSRRVKVIKKVDEDALKDSLFEIDEEVAPAHASASASSSSSQAFYNDKTQQSSSHDI